MSKKVLIKTQEQIANIRQAGVYLTQLLQLLQETVEPGMTGNDLEEIAENFLHERNVTGAFKWYNWFPANLCISINDCLVHGIPDDIILKEWDLLKIDVWVTYNGGIADAAISLIVWWKEYNPQWEKLIQATKWSLDNALQYIVPHQSMFAFGKAVQQYMNQRKFSVIKNLTWHGVGIDVHEWPSIFNRPNGELQRYTWKPWMIVALEPITAIKSTVYKEKKWIPRNLYTKKWDLGAQREYTILITEMWYEILAWIV